MHFFGLHIKSFLNLKNYGATFGIGEGKIAPPPGYAPGVEWCTSVGALLRIVRSEKKD